MKLDKSLGQQKSNPVPPKQVTGKPVPVRFFFFFFFFFFERGRGKRREIIFVFFFLNFYFFQVFVGNLTAKVNAKMLENAFKQFGNISTEVYYTNGGVSFFLLVALFIYLFIFLFFVVSRIWARSGRKRWSC
jgi:hypothetical protein